MTRMRALVTTVPFGEVDRRPLDLLEGAGIEYVINPMGRRLSEIELADMIADFDVAIAGTEPITLQVMERARRLKLISRVGVGLDNVDLVAARERGILVSYTPAAPAPAVAELAIGLMLSLLRSIHTVDRAVRTDGWRRITGRRLGAVTVGVIGAGRIGSRVVSLLSAFGAHVLVNDVRPLSLPAGVTQVDKARIFDEADVITLHVPLTRSTTGMIALPELNRMKHGVLVINTSRGGVIDEADLASALHAGRIGGAAIDVFCQEPYAGPLLGLDRCLITCHMGSMSRDCRAQMEIEATENAVQYASTGVPGQLVPEAEYDLRSELGAV